MSNPVVLTPLKIIPNENGQIKHALKKSDPHFLSFGEVYFSEVEYLKIKGWKKHSLMTLNLIVPKGEVKFVVMNVDQAGKPHFQEFIIGDKNYCRLTIPPLYWVAFQGLTKDTNIVLNIASIEHDPKECENTDLNTFSYDWKK
jgi:dTDP-4-dehydrorhamnose 3,5-epimerase